MATVEQLALAHYKARQRLVKAADAAAARMWAQVDPHAITRSWSGLRLALVAVLAEAQRQAADAANTYVPAVQGGAGEPVHVVAGSLSGVASDGRSLSTLLEQPAISTVLAIAQGAATDRALFSGGLQLRLMARTQVADAGRVADGVYVTGSRHGGYVRMLNPPSCSRCAILAGRWYRWNSGFQRHPSCDCVHIPAAESVAGDLVVSPKAYFNSLSEADQNRIFTNAGAQAIRDGADPARVVNARRGMYTAGGRTLTTERAKGGIRPMPEQLYRDAATREQAIALLRRFGFIL